MATVPEIARFGTRLRPLSDIADHAATYDQCVEGVIERLANAERELSYVAGEGLRAETEDHLGRIQCEVILCAFALRGAKANTSPTGALLDLLEKLQKEGGEA